MKTTRNCSVNRKCCVVFIEALTITWPTCKGLIEKHYMLPMKEGKDNGICKAHLRDLRLSTTCPVTTTFLTVLRHPAKPTRLSIHCHGDVWISSIGKIVDFQGHSRSLKVIGRIGSTPASEGHIEVVNISSKRKEDSCLPACIHNFAFLHTFII